jgi:hypothetical protein
MPSRTALVIRASAYGLLVFLGTALVGFVVVPTIAYVSGLFELQTEAQATFSLITLKAVPFLVGLSAAAAATHDLLTGLSAARRVAICLATMLLAWLTGAAIAVLILG